VNYKLKAYFQKPTPSTPTFTPTIPQPSSPQGGTESGFASSYSVIMNINKNQKRRKTIKKKNNHHNHNHKFQQDPLLHPQKNFRPCGMK
jgi:hypothetical protein